MILPGLLPRLRGLESSDLMTHARQLEELCAHPSLRFVTELMGQGRESLVRQLIHAPKSDVGEYAHLAGTITGMDIFGDVIETVRAEARRVAEKIEAGEFRQEGV